MPLVTIYLAKYLLSLHILYLHKKKNLHAEVGVSRRLHEDLEQASNVTCGNNQCIICLVMWTNHIENSWWGKRHFRVFPNIS